MSEIVVAQRMWQRRDTVANWAAQNPILNAGEIGVQIETDGSISQIKIGNGTDAWNDLAYFSGDGGGGGFSIPELWMYA